MISSEISPSEQLDTDYDEEHPEQQQRSLADRVAEDLDNGQVDEDDGADQAEQQAEAAEQVQRAVAIPAHEGHREQVEETAHVPLDAVVRTPVLAGPMIDGQLRDAVAAVVGEDGDVAMELAVELHAVDDLGAVCLEPAVQSWRRTPETLPATVLKIFDGTRRVIGSRRFVFHPETRS